ncbi:unnamed protein product, partial [Durusdinium trenchii]
SPAHPAAQLAPTLIRRGSPLSSNSGSVSRQFKRSSLIRPKVVFSRMPEGNEIQQHELPHVPSNDGDDEIMPVVLNSQKEDKLQASGEKRTMASFCKLFSMMDAVDALVLLIGVIGAVGNGISQPLMCIVFGDLIDGMGMSTPGDFSGLTAEQTAALMDQAMSG